MMQDHLKDGFDIYVYNNSKLNTPVHVYPDDEYTGDVAYILLPGELEPPKNINEIYSCVLNYGAIFNRFRDHCQSAYY